MQLTPRAVLLQFGHVLQQELFPRLAEATGPLSPAHQLLVAVSALVPFDRHLKPRARTGRPRRDRLALATAFLAKAILNLPTTRDLIERLNRHSGVPEVAWLIEADGPVIYHNGDCQPADAEAAYDFLRRKAARIDLAFVFPVHEENLQYARQNAALFQRFDVRAVFPMHAQAGDARYLAFRKAWQEKLPHLPIRVPSRMGERFVYGGGAVQR